MTYTINRFYTRLEKLGLKYHHTTLKSEEEYWDSLNKYNMYDTIIENEKYLTKHFRNILQKTQTLMIMFLIFSLISFFGNLYNLYFLVPLLISGIYSRILYKRIIVTTFESGLFKIFKQQEIDYEYNNKHD